MEFFLTLSLFALKVLIVVLAVGGLVALILLLVHKSQSLKPILEIENLNHHFKDLEHSLQMNLLNKDKLKKAEKAWTEDSKKWDQEERPKSFILDFKGDIQAHGGTHLREEITAILTVATPQDEVILKVESPGGVVHGYGFCASQLERIRAAGLPLTVCVDKVAASGGYMMAVVANKVLAAPFAIVGSIGVVAQVPNFHRLLQKHDVDYKEYTAGAFKRTVSLLGEITPEGESKFRTQLEETHTLFKDHIQHYRPSLSLEKVATGEHWYGRQAKDLGLIDEIMTSDDYLMMLRSSRDLIQISYKAKKTFSEKLSDAFGLAAVKIYDRFIEKNLIP